MFRLCFTISQQFYRLTTIFILLISSFPTCINPFTKESFFRIAHFELYVKLFLLRQRIFYRYNVLGLLLLLGYLISHTKCNFNLMNDRTFPLEPTNNVPPKSPGRRVGSVFSDFKIGDQAALTCDATGYPVPKYRYDQHNFVWSVVFRLIEPTGQTAPKTSGDGLNKQVTVTNLKVALLCDVQSFPVPRKRYIPFK